MKKTCTICIAAAVILAIVGISIAVCLSKKPVTAPAEPEYVSAEQPHSDSRIVEGDTITVTGTVWYSVQPSDIGERYCLVSGIEELSYSYMDIYDQSSEYFTTEVFTRQDADTELLKAYAGQQVTVTGTFEAETHGIPYITDIEVLSHSGQATDISWMDAYDRLLKDLQQECQNSCTYSLYDMEEDGTPEMFVQWEEDSAYQVYTVTDGTAIRLEREIPAYPPLVTYDLHDVSGLDWKSNEEITR